MKRIFTFGIIGVFFVCAVGNATQGYMLNDFIRTYMIESGAQGLVGTVFAFGQIMALFFVFFAAGRILKMSMITIAFAVIVVVFMLLSFAPPYFVFLSLYIVFGLMFGTINTVSSSLVADINDQQDVQRYMCILHGVFGLGGLMAPLLFLLLTNGGLQWDMILRVLAALFLLMYVAYCVIVRITKPRTMLKSSCNAPVRLGDIAGMIKSRKGIMLISAAFSYGAHQIVFIVWIHRYVSVQLGSESFGAISLSLFWLGSAISRLLMPKMHIKLEYHLIYGNILAAIIVVVGIISNLALVMTMCTFLAGITAGATVPLLLAKGCEIYPDKTVIATNTVLMSIFAAQMTIPVVVALISNSISYPAGMALSAAFAIATSLASRYLQKEKVLCNALQE